MIHQPHAEQIFKLSLWTLAVTTFLVGCGTQSSRDDDFSDVTDATVKTVSAQGRILPAKGFRRLAAVGTVSQIHVKLDQDVKKGDLLVTMQSQQSIALQLNLASERLIEARQQKRLAEVQAQQLVTAAELKLQQIEAKRSLLDADQARLLKLAEDQVKASQAVMARLELISADQLTGEFVGQLEIDRQKVAIQEAELKLEQQRVLHKQNKDELNFMEEVARTELNSAQESLQAASKSRAVEIAESQIAVLEEQASAAVITAPVEGRITAINVKRGEASVQVPIIEMADLSELVCEVEINELDAGSVNLHDQATIRSRAFSDEELTGHITRISNVVGRPQLKPFDPLAPVDYRSRTAVIELDEPGLKLAREWLQLQVDVSIAVEPGKAGSASENEAEGGQEG